MPKGGSPSPLMLLYGFAGIIALGTILLMLPISSKAGQLTPVVNALFTSTSAVCVTGLIVVDTGTYWSSFGQAVIIALVQIGGFGFMTGATLFLIMMGRRITLRERMLARESMGMTPLGGLVGLVKRMAIFTIAIEGIGAAILFFHLSSTHPPGTALWQGTFQAISAFNNAGFDIFGNFQSLGNYQGDPIMLGVTALLVILGGISFMVIADVFRFKRFGKFSLDSKIVLTTTGLLLALGMGLILFGEFSNPATLGSMPLPQKMLDAFFHSVTARTAGFTTIDMGKAVGFSLFLTMLLMFIGGAAGSTAGGIKVNTFGMLLATIWCSIRGREYAGAFGREFPEQQIHRALAIVTLAIGLVAISVLLLTITEPFRFIDLLFETVSAFGTVGLSTGITPQLSLIGKIIIAVTMFCGRLGPITMALSLVQRQQPSLYRYPQDMVRIG